MALSKMIKYVANEPSVGLHYVQQHAHNAVPHLLHLKDRVVDRSHEATLHTEDLEDSIIMVRSMKDCGFSIADEMVKDINKSLMVLSRSQPKRGLIGDWSSSFQMGKRSSSWGPRAFSQYSGFSQQEGESAGSYLSTVFNSAKQKAVSIRWPQLDTKQEIAAQTADEQLKEAIPIDDNSTRHALSLASQDYEEFKADRVAKLEEWLEEHENMGKCREGNNSELNIEETST